jgi:hypothetical protein
MTVNKHLRSLQIRNKGSFAESYLCVNCSLQAEFLRPQSCASGGHLARLTELELCRQHDRCIATDWILEVKYKQK